MKNFGQKLKFLREEKELSQMQLSKLIDIPQATIARYELDISEPRVSEIKKFCTFFNISSDDLIGLNEDTENKIQNINQTFNFTF